MTEKKLSKLWYELEDEEKKAEVEYCKMFNSTPEEVPLNEMVRFRSGYCMGRHYGYLAGLHEGQEENNRLLDVINGQDVKIADLEKKVKEIEHNKKTVVHLSECISDIQDKQIEQAKKIIERLCNAVRTLNNPNTELTDVDDFLSEAEQFIKEK